MDVEFFQELFSRMDRQYAQAMEHNSAMLTEFVNNFANHMNTSNANSNDVLGKAGHRGIVGKVKDFDGSSDPKVINGFLASLHLKFAIRSITDDRSKVMIFGSHLVDGAQMWFSSVVNEGYDNVGYDELVDLFKKRFLPVRYAKDARSKLKELKQRKAVGAYIQEFTELASLVDPPYNNSVILLDQFIEGLKPAVKVHVENQDPHTIEDAFELAQKTDKTVWKYNVTPVVAQPVKSKDPDAMDLDELRAVQGSSKNYLA